MARTQEDPASRIRILESAKARTRKLKRGATLSAQPMSELAGVSWPTLRGYCNDLDGFEASGAFRRGAEGIAWTFDPRKTIAFLLKHFRGIQRENVAETKRVKAVVGGGGSALDSVPDDFDLDKIGKLVRVSKELQRSRQDQGLLVEAAPLADLFMRYNSTVQNAILEAGQKADPTGTWPADIRDSFEHELRSVLVHVEAEARKVLGLIDGRPTQPAAA